MSYLTPRCRSRRRLVQRLLSPVGGGQAHASRVTHGSRKMTGLAEDETAVNLTHDADVRHAQHPCI